jgi:hypothetical protein
MDRKMVEDIRKNWANKSSEELVQIWKENDHERWSDSAFEAVKQILAERVVELPPQNPSKATKIRMNEKILVSQKEKRVYQAAALGALILLYFFIALVGDWRYVKGNAETVKYQRVKTNTTSFFSGTVAWIYVGVNIFGYSGVGEMLWDSGSEPYRIGFVFGFITLLSSTYPIGYLFAVVRRLCESMSSA